MTTTLAIVGAGQNKFTPELESLARHGIRNILFRFKGDFPDLVVKSGESPAGGVDHWAHQLADLLHVPFKPEAPDILQWESYNGRRGYKERNEALARSDYMLVMLVKDYPPNYAGEKALGPTGKPYCFHCGTTTHVRSGACWSRIAYEAGRRRRAMVLIL
jgi:hypothetical protein